MTAPEPAAESMQILFDQGTPAPLRNVLVGHRVTTAYEMGWAELENGELLELAEARFDIFITTDQSLSYQRNLIGRKIAHFGAPNHQLAEFSVIYPK